MRRSRCTRVCRGETKREHDAYMTGKAIIGHDCGGAWCYNELWLAALLCFVHYSVTMLQFFIYATCMLFEEETSSACFRDRNQ